MFTTSAFAAGDIAVVREWDGVAVPNGGSFSFGADVPNAPDSRRFRIYNNGTTNLVISNPTQLVSGPGFSMIAYPVGTVHAGASTTFRVQFLASAPGDYNGAITIYSNDPDSNPYVIHLYGAVTAPPAPDIAVVREWDDVAVPNGGSFSFGAEPANTPDSRRFRIHNTGNLNLDISNPTTLVSGEGFSMIAYPVGTVYAGASTTFRVQFLASAPGDYHGTITIQSNDPDENPYVIDLYGAVTAPSLPDIAVFQDWDNVAVPDGGSFAFPDVVAGSPDSRRFRITNTGNGPLTLGNPAALVSGACFSQIETPATPIAAGASAWFRVRILCSTPGTYTGTVSIQNDDADENPYDLTVSGRVVGAATPEIAVLRDWDNVAVPDGGSFTFPDADSRRFRITNTGSAPLTLANPATLVSGACFSQIETPVTPIAAGASSWFRVRILCSTPGTYTGTVSIQNDDADENPYDFTVSGTVVTSAPEIGVYRQWDNVAVPDGGSYVYPNPVPAGQADSRTFRIENSGNAPLTIGNPNSLVSGTCFSQSGPAPASSIAPGASTTFTVQVLCNTAGTYTGAVTIQNNDGNENPYDVALQAVVGTVDFNVSVAPRFSRVHRGTSITATVSVTGAPGVTVSLSTADLPAGTTASFNPASIRPGEHSTLTIQAAHSGPFGDFSIRVKGTSGGVTRDMTATLRVADPDALPVINTIEPETIPAGEISTVTLTGENFHTSELTVGGAAAGKVDRQFPTIKVVSVSEDGSQMEVQVDATDPAVLHHYALYLKNFHGEDGISFRVIPEGPVIDFWSPSDAAGGTVYAMDLVGINLEGAIVMSPGGGVSVFDVDNSDDELLSGFLRIEGGAAGGPIDLTIRGKNGDATIRIEIRQQRSQVQKKTSALTDSKGEPLFYVQELTPREDLLRSKLANPSVLTHGFEWDACAEWGRSRRKGRAWTRTWVKNPLTGEWGAFGDQILNELRIGEIRLLETRTFSRWFELELSMNFRVCISEDSGFDYDVEACVTGSAGFHIPIVGGLGFEFEFCLGNPNNWEIHLQGTGFLSFIQFHRRGNTGQPEELQCVRITDLDPKSGSGERTFEVELIGCCSENVGVGWSGDFYPGFMQVSSQHVGTARPGQGGPEPCLELRFTTSPTHSMRVIDPYPQSNVRIGVLRGDTLIFRGEPALSSNQYSWGGVMSGGTGQETSVHFSLSGSFIGTLSALGTTRSARITVKNEPPPPNQIQWGIQNLAIAQQVLQLRDQADAWADRTFGPDPTGNGRSNAARHAYGVCLVTIHFGLEAAEGAAMAHERTNFETGERDIHNAMVMDLENNAKALVFSGPLTTEDQCQAAVIQALNNGELIILDDPENPGGNSLLVPSNQ